MITEQIQRQSKYYQFYTVATILGHVIDCFHTIVNDKSNPYHPPLSWFTNLSKQLRPLKDELFHNLFEECFLQKSQVQGIRDEFSPSLCSRIEKLPKKERREIVSRTKDGCSPLFVACKLGLRNIAKYLIDVCGADIEQKGRFEDPFAREEHHTHAVTPIWVAAISGNLDVLKLLIDYGANINATSDTGSTPLRSTCFLCKDDENSQPRLINSMDASHATNDVYMGIVRLLVENNADVSKTNYNGVTCLINSIHNYVLTEYILDHGSDIDAIDLQSKTALHYAILQGRLEVTKLLLRRGANPLLLANSRDDALQLSCIGGHIEIFNHLLKEVDYKQERIVDAYKLLGCSLLEIRFDITKARELWITALNLKSGSGESNLSEMASDKIICDNRRSIAYENASEFENEDELNALTIDGIRIQSLLITERCLGSQHRETIQRLIYRGTCYINSLRPGRCIDLWIYALKLRIQHESISRNESIFQYEIIFAAKAITKLLLDQSPESKHCNRFRDLYDVLMLLVEQLDGCRHHFDFRPTSRLHQEMYDMLLGVTLNLLYALHCCADKPIENDNARRLTRFLIEINPRTSDGSSLLHLCLSPGILSDERIFRTVAPVRRTRQKGDSSPLIDLITILLANGLAVDLTNCEGLSALQVLCLTSIEGTDKGIIARALVKSGAHVDRRSTQHCELIHQTLLENGINPFSHLTLSCLSARKIAESKIKFDEKILTRSLRESIAIH